MAFDLTDEELQATRIMNGTASKEELYERIAELEEIEKEHKKENGELRNKIDELENADLSVVYMNGFYDGEKKWKDKINEKIADYTEKSQTPLVNSQSIREYTFGIRAFQRLLEERN